MPIKQSDLRMYGSANMLEDNTTTTVGGAIATSVSLQPTDLDATDNIQIISSAAGDTTQTVTTTGRATSGAFISEVKTLNGQTAVPMTATTSWERLEKAVKSGTTTGDVAIERVTATNSGTCQAGSTADTIVLAAGASAVDGFYVGFIVRTTGGTGPNQIRAIIGYVGATKIATVSSAFGVTPDGTTTYRVSTGFYFQKLPSETLTCRRVFYAASSDIAGGAQRKYYEKVFLKNDHATLALTAATVQEITDPLSKIQFALATAVNDSGTNGANTRLVIPSSGIGAFSSGTTAVPGNQLNPGDAIAVWLELTLNAGDSPAKSSYTPQLNGSTT